MGQLDSGPGGIQSPAPPPPTTNNNSLEKKKTKKDGKRKGRAAVDEMTAEEREAVTIVFHQFETGLREGTIFTKVNVRVCVSSQLKKLGTEVEKTNGVWKLPIFFEYIPESTLGEVL